jgi:hypothetical protein
MGIRDLPLPIADRFLDTLKTRVSVLIKRVLVSRCGVL